MCYDRMWHLDYKHVIIIARVVNKAPIVVNYALRVVNYAPRVFNYAPRVVSYAPRVVNFAPRVMLQIVASLTDDSSGIIYSCNIFIV